MAEFFGTMILVIFGDGANCQVVLSSIPAVASSPKGVSLGFTTRRRDSDLGFLSNIYPLVSASPSVSSAQGQDDH